MHWEKLGQVFAPAGQFDWVRTHAMLPTADQIGDDLFRIYFSGRDDQNISRTGYVEIDIKDPTTILAMSARPVLDIGELGSFDDNGVSPTWITNVGDEKYFYFMGWNKGSKVRAAEVSGLAISIDGGRTFVRHSRAPVIDRTDAEPYTILVVSCILVENGVWRMWYDSADYWINEGLPRYNIKYAESTDGIHWRRDGFVAVNYKNDNETRVSRAAVIEDDGVYRMWLCCAQGSDGYLMGYAESVDGRNFVRDDDRAGISLSATGWDSEMVCYPNVFKHKGEIYMLYCGNGYGRTGFGLAILRK